MDKRFLCVRVKEANYSLSLAEKVFRGQGPEDAGELKLRGTVVHPRGLGQGKSFHPPMCDTVISKDAFYCVSELLFGFCLCFNRALTNEIKVFRNNNNNNNKKEVSARRPVRYATRVTTQLTRRPKPSQQQANS